MRAVLRIKALREQVGLTTTADGLLRLAEFFHCTIDELYDRDASRRGSA